MMRGLVIFVLFGGVFGAPNWRGGRQEGGGAEVIRIVDEKTPILLSGMTESDNTIVVDTVPEVKDAGNSTVVSAPPTPVPEEVALTTEKLAQNTPDLVPSVVDIATVAPSNTPPSVNGTGPPRPPPPEEEDEEDSEEEAGSEEEAEEDEEEDEEDEEGDDEEDEEDEEEDEEKGKALKKVKREVNGEEISESVKVKPVGGSVVIGEGVDEDVKQSDEEDKDVGGKMGGEGVTGVPVGLQGVSALSATGEDDEADSVLQGGSKGGGSIVLGKV